MQQIKHIRPATPQNGIKLGQALKNVFVVLAVYVAIALVSNMHF